MKIPFISFVSLLSLPLLALNATAQELESERIIVRFKDSVQIFSLNHEIQRFRGMPEFGVMTVPADQSMQAMLTAYRQRDDVLYAEPDYPLQSHRTPNDPFFNNQWNLNNFGQSIAELGGRRGTFDSDINGPEAWDITTGNDAIVVGVIDTGIDYTHPDLIANLWVNPGEIPNNGIDDDNNGYIDDIHGINAITGSGDPFDDSGHGTHVSGILGAEGNNARGIAGINWNTTIIACKFLGPRAAEPGFVSDAIECLDYLLNLKTRTNNPVNVRLTNNSWGGNGRSQALVDAIAAHQNAEILFVTSAGNDRQNMDDVPNFPAAYDLPGIISVAASDENDELTTFSNFGVQTTDIAAPGARILSTVPSGNCELCTGSGYAFVSGTSMASPHVAGLAALMMAQNPGLTIREIKNLVISAGTRINALNSRVLAGARLRAADGDGSGAMTCLNRNLQRRVSPLPRQTQINVPANQSLTLSAININCNRAAGAPTLSSTGGNIALRDQGGNGDAFANDGIYSNTFRATAPTTITFPNNDVLTVNLPAAYFPPALTPFNYRNIIAEGEALLKRTDPDTNELTIFGGASLPTPFPIQFGGVNPGFDRIGIDNNGKITFDDITIDQENTPLPFTTRATLVAPYWDDLDHVNGDDIYIATLGTAPNREFVVEWRSIRHAQQNSNNPESITFQVVFFEGSSNVVFNYLDVDFNDPRLNGGRSATIGLQTTNNNVQQLGFNENSVSSNMALLWSLSVNANSTQTVQAPRRRRSGGGSADWLFVALLIGMMISRRYSKPRTIKI